MPGLVTHPLPVEAFALDSEADVYEDGIKRSRLLQFCPVSATGLQDVETIYGWDCWTRFFGMLEDTVSRRTLRCHMYNLGGYEFSHMFAEVLKDEYEYTEERMPKKGQWCFVADDKTVYKVMVRSYGGTLIEFTDDMRRMGGVSMEKASSAIKSQHPEWFVGMERTKLDSDYHEGWLDESDPDFEESMAYSIQDAYSQAMIARWLRMNGLDGKLTAPSNGLQMALSLTYCDKELSEATRGGLKFALGKFTKKYPPLNREMQDLAERSLLGGFVWGRTGTWKGTFCHADYSSSYPYEYVYGDMFIGKVEKVHKGDRFYDMYRSSENIKRWFVVSFDFEYIDGMMGCISGRECVTDEDPMIGRYNKKMRTGHVERRLYTESYLEELGKHYRLTNMVEHEMWVAKRMTGGFDKFIKYCYEKKNQLKEQGMDGSADYLIWKLFMNGGFHGKSITKTNRRKRTYQDGKVAYRKEVNDPTLCFMLGFTAMMNARERLLKHCRMVVESGHHVMMCDTDSMIIDCTGDELRGIIGDWFCAGGKQMEGNLGMFEVETDKKMAKKQGLIPMEEFDELRCWGLKRYCEIRTSDGVRYTRKTAFAGMHDEVQQELMDWETDGREYEWKQAGKRTEKYGAVIVEASKHMKAENIWDEGRKTPPKPKDRIDLSRMKEVHGAIKDARRKVLI